MDYNHANTRLKLDDVAIQENPSLWKQFLSRNDPLKQQADLERSRLGQRPSRATRYTGNRIYEIGEQEIEDRSPLVGVKVFGYSFLSGFAFASFLSIPVGCLLHSLRPANMASDSVVGDMLFSGLRMGVRNGVAYGSLLAVFRVTNYALSGAFEDRKQSPTNITIAGTLGSAVGSVIYAGGFRRPLFVIGCTAVGAGLFFSASQYVLRDDYAEGFGEA